MSSSSTVPSSSATSAYTRSSSSSSSSSTVTVSTTPSSSPLSSKDLKDISIARTMFIAGCFLLPWLWIANLVYYRHRLWGSSNSSGGNSNDDNNKRKNTTTTGAQNTTPCPPELRKYLYRSLIGTIITTIIFITWVSVYQTNWRNMGNIGSSLLIWTPDDRWWLWSP